jgi:cation diffusion facilitator family transporter
VSWRQAHRQLRSDAASMERNFRRQLWDTSDPAVTTVFFEDTAALIGLVIAATGVTLHQVTGNHIWDGLASVAIGLLLAVVGFLLGRENRSLLIGEAADSRLHDALVELLSSYDEVDAVDEVLTTVIGRGEVLVAARIDLDDDLRAAQVEALARRMESEITTQFPQVKHFFLDVTADATPPAPAPSSSKP